MRLDAVQEITNLFSGSQPNYHGQTLTTITQLEFLGLPVRPGRGVVYTVQSEAELLGTLAPLIEMVRNRVLPFFDEYRTIETVNGGLNPVGAECVLEASSDRRAFDASNQPYRSMTGVTVAHLARDSRVLDLIDAYRNQLREARPDDRQKLENLIVYLRENVATD
jgi:hypothetical protein